MDLKTAIKYFADHYEVNEERKKWLLIRLIIMIDKERKDRIKPEGDIQ